MKKKQREKPAAKTDERLVNIIAKAAMAVQPPQCISVEFLVTCGAVAKLQNAFEALTPALRERFLIEILRTVLAARGCEKETRQREELNALFGWKIGDLIHAGGCQLAVCANVLNSQIDICFALSDKTPEQKFCQMCSVAADNATFGRLLVALRRELQLPADAQALMEGGPTYLPITDFPFRYFPL